jgi:hypothetical protein
VKQEVTFGFSSTPTVVLHLSTRLEYFQELNTKEIYS